MSPSLFSFFFHMKDDECFIFLDINWSLERYDKIHNTHTQKCYYRNVMLCIYICFFIIENFVMLN